MTRKNCLAATVYISATVALLLLCAASLPAQISALYKFTGKPDGSKPQGRLIVDSAGNFYGTTFNGGVHNRGSIYKLTATSGETVLYSFTGGTDGAFPMGNLLIDNSGNLFGTTSGGGNPAACFNTLGCGTIFKLNPSGQLFTLYKFSGQADGALPMAGLIRDLDGAFYGTASIGGTRDGVCLKGGSDPGCGVVFKFKYPNTYTVLHTFTGAPDGLDPLAPLTRDSAGNLYGTTIFGGNYTTDNACAQLGCGVVFKIDTAGNETVLHAFGIGTDGSWPQYGQLTLDSSGNIYGVTTIRGPGQFGTVFSLDSAGNETILYGFTGQTDGGSPYGGLARDVKGNLYGTTSGYGKFGGPCGSHGCGVVFKVTPAGREVVLGRFNFQDGAAPLSDLILYKQTLYGATSLGPFNAGVVFTIKP
jgi:uncharacterized repeat protein (TIGR03803 family)